MQELSKGLVPVQAGTTLLPARIGTSGCVHATVPGAFERDCRVLGAPPSCSAPA